MGDITVTAADVRPANAQQCDIRNLDAAEDLTVGQCVYINSSGDVAKADANAATEAPARGVGFVIESLDGETTVLSGHKCSVIVFGPMEGFVGMTPGEYGFVSKTAGSIDHTAPTGGAYQHSMGRAESATCFWVNPVMSSPTSV